MTETRELLICIAGFGNVTKRFLQLLQEKEAYLADEHGLRVVVTGVCSPSRGILIRGEGVSAEELFALDSRPDTFAGLPAFYTPWDERGALAMLDSCPADVFIELSTLSIRDGEPASRYIERAFERKMHAITANKGPEAWHFDRLMRNAREADCEYLFESAVMDGTPIFSLARETLRGCEIHGVRGILNGTSNFVLSALERGMTATAAIAEAQRLQFAEADPSLDLDGWDGAAKLCAMANVLMGAKANPTQVERVSAAPLTTEDIERAKDEGCVIKYICRAERDETGDVRLSVRPEKIKAGDAFASVNGASAAVTLFTDLAGELTIIQTDPGILQTAYGVYADLLAIAERRGFSSKTTYRR